MPTLTDLQQAAQGGSTLGGIKSNTGVAPSNAQTASSLGASSNAAQMAGTPAQQAAAIKESVSTKSTLDYMKRTESGRAQAKEGQSATALEKVEAAKQLAGLGGKVAAATQAAVSASTNLPLTVTANLDTYVSDDPALMASLPADMKVLQDAIFSQDGNAQLQAWKTIKSKYNLTTDAVARMFNVPPETLWSQLESSLTGTKVTLKDLAGVVDPAQIEAAKQLLPAMESTALDNMTWQEAKALINQTLNNATANTVDLQKQASDQTLPASTRAMAVQRLRELGVTGEYQSADIIQGEQGKLEAADNVRIGDKEYEVQDVLNSPEAKDAIINVLNGTAELKDLEGGPLAGLIPLIKNHADELAAKFGIGEDGKIGVGKLQQIEITRSTNQKGITAKLAALGLPVPNKDDKEVLKSIGITDDVLNGYAEFDAQVLENNPTLTVIRGLPEGEQAGAWATLSKPGMATLLNRPDKDGLVSLLKSPAGRETLGQLSAVESFLKSDDFKTEGGEAEEVKSVFNAMGLDNLFAELQTAAGVNLSGVGIDLPATLDANRDGVVDDMATIQKSLMNSGKSLDEIKAELDKFKAMGTGKIDAAVTNKKLFDSADTIINEVNESDYTQQDDVLKSIADIKGSGLINFTKQRKGLFTSTVLVKPDGVPQAAFDNAVAKYNKLNGMATKMKAEKELDTKRDLEITGAINASADPGPGLWNREADRINTLTSAWSGTQSPAIKQRATEAIRNSLITLLTYHPERNYNNRALFAGGLLDNPAVRSILGPEHVARFEAWAGQKTRSKEKVAPDREVRPVKATKELSGEGGINT